MPRESDGIQERASFCCSLSCQEASVSVYSDLRVVQAGLANELVDFARVAPGFKVAIEPVTSQQSIYVLESNETGLVYDEQSRKAYREMYDYLREWTLQAIEGKLPGQTVDYIQEQVDQGFPDMNLFYSGKDISQRMEELSK